MMIIERNRNVGQKVENKFEKDKEWKNKYNYTHKILIT